jgi:GDP-4-dehydro-6-deoxy-D-mannose reductase
VRVLVTGATGFVGTWLMQELTSAGHQAVGAPSSRELDINDGPGLARLVEAVAPDAVAHLAAISFAGAAARDPDAAVAVNAGGTGAVLTAVAESAPSAPVLVTSSSEVYGRPAPQDLPLREGHAPRPIHAYGRSKLAQEEVALELAAKHGIPLVITRAFNHTGPGQRTDFVIPALASRILEAMRGGRNTIRAGNVDVRRDIGDVRDVVRAYRLLLEAAVEAGRPSEPAVYNVATGRSIRIRDVIAELASLAGATVEVETDPALVRPDDPPEIRGDATKLKEAIGWSPEWPLSTTLADVLASVARS